MIGTIHRGLIIIFFLGKLNQIIIKACRVSAKSSCTKTGTCTKNHEHDIKSIMFAIPWIPPLYICVCQNDNSLAHLSSTKILSCLSITSKALLFLSLQIVQKIGKRYKTTHTHSVPGIAKSEPSYEFPSSYWQGTRSCLSKYKPEGNL